MEPKKDNAGTTIESGFTGQFTIKVIPVTQLSIQTSRATKQGKLCKLVVKGQCSNLPDSQAGTLTFTNHYDGIEQPQVSCISIKLKISGNDRIKNYELVKSDGSELIVDPIECGLITTGGSDLKLEVSFPYAPVAILLEAMEFNFPFDMKTEKSHGDIIGSTYKITPVYDSIFNDCTIEYLLAETDDDEPDEIIKGRKQEDYSATLTWDTGKKDARKIFLGFNEDQKLVIANKPEQGNYEFKRTATIKRGSFSTTINYPQVKVQKPKLEKFTVTFVDVPYFLSSKRSSSPYDFQSDVLQSSMRQFRVDGQFKGFAPGLNLKAECILVMSVNEKIFWKSESIFQIIDIKQDGSFSEFIGELVEDERPLFEELMNYVYFAGIRIAENYLSISPLPVLNTFTATALLPAVSYLNSSLIPETESWMLSSPTNYAGVKLEGRKDLVTFDELKSIIPKAKDENIGKYFKHINDTLLEFGINNKFRIAHFLCNVPVETGDLVTVEQQGTTLPYKGRGIIQLTGEGNYKSFSEYMKNSDVFQKPQIVADDASLACRSAGWWWKLSNNIDTSLMADKEDFIGIALKVNYKANGLSERWDTLKRAYKVLGIDNAATRIDTMRAEAAKKNYKLT